MTQQQQEQESALVVVEDIAESPDNPALQRFQTIVTLPPNFQYLTGKRGEEKRAITSDGYDYMNRALGASFFLPDFVPDESGDMVRNPIHRPDYIYMRMTAIWRNEMGQLVSATEDLEVDYKATWQQARLETWNSSLKVDEHGQPMFDPKTGQPLIIVTDDGGQGRYPKSAVEKERDAMKALMSLRTTGLRYAQTVLRVRLLKIATGIKTLDGNQLRAKQVRIVGWRDGMTPQTREDEASAAMGALFSARPVAITTITDEEMRDIEGENPEAVVVHPQDDAMPQPDHAAVMENQPATLTDAEKFAEMQAENRDNGANRQSDMSNDEQADAIAAEYEEMMAAQQS